MMGQPVPAAPGYRVSDTLPGSRCAAPNRLTPCFSPAVRRSARPWCLRCLLLVRAWASGHSV